MVDIASCGVCSCPFCMICQYPHPLLWVDLEVCPQAFSGSSWNQVRHQVSSLSVSSLQSCEVSVLPVLLDVDKDVVLAFLMMMLQWFQTVRFLLLDVQLVNVLLEPPDDVIDEAHLTQWLDDDIVEDRCCQFLDLDVGSEVSMLSSVPLMVVDVDIVLLQVVPQDVGIDGENVHI